MRYRTFTWAAVAFLATAGPALAARPVLGFVDVMRLQNEFTQVKKLQSDMEAESQKYDAELREGQQRLAEIDAAIASADVAAKATSDIAVRKKSETAKADQEALRDKTQSEFAQKLGERRKKAEALQHELNDDVLGRVKGAVEQVGKKHNLDGVLDSRASLWGAVDLTDEVLAVLNASKSAK